MDPFELKEALYRATLPIEDIHRAEISKTYQEEEEDGFWSNRAQAKETLRTQLLRCLLHLTEKSLHWMGEAVLLVRYDAIHTVQLEKSPSQRKILSIFKQEWT